MCCIYSYIGSFTFIFHVILMFNFIFESKPALHSVLNSTSYSEEDILPYYASKRKRIDDVLDIGSEPKIITLKEKTMLSYSYKLTVNFLIIQAHTQYRNLTLSNYYGTEANTNSDTAILDILFLKQKRDKVFYRLDYFLRPPSGVSVQTLVTAVAYNGGAPIPGGCCITCTLEVDPNLVVTSKQFYKTVLSFSLANIYDASDCSGRRGSKPSHYRLHYSIYQYFLEEGNLKNDELFDGISKMLTPSKVKENGKKVRDWNPQTDRPLVVFDTERGQGIVFNILIFDPMTNAESVYSPVVTYGCSFTAKVDGCDSLGSIANLVLATCGCLFGLFMCFFGQRFYRLYILGSGFTLFSFAGFVLLTSQTEWSHDVRIIGSVCIGITCGLLVYLLWWWTGYKHLVLYICGLPFGFLLSAVLFFTPFGNMHYWKNDVNFWTVFFCMWITIPCIFLICLKAFAILVSSLVGAYGFIVGIDTFIHSSMIYIILNVIMKATVDDFVRYDVPFQTKDYILCGVWSVLTILGLIVQFVTSKGKPALPDEAPRKKRKREATRTNRPVADSVGVINNENDPLPTLVNSQNRTISSEQDDDERLPILIESRSSRTNGIQQQSTRYGTNVVC